MICKKHGDIQLVKGKCYLCYQEEVVSEITYRAQNWQGGTLASGQPPFRDAPYFLLNPRDFPWLLDKTVSSDTAQLFRDVLAHTYILYAAAALDSSKVSKAEQFIDLAVDFRPQESDWTLWQIHYESALYNMDTPAGKTATEKAESGIKLSDHDLFCLATIASHFEIGLRHLALVPNRLRDTIVNNQEMENSARGILNSILLMGNFEIKGDYLIEKRTFDSGPLERFVNWIVPASARVLPKGRPELFSTTLKALDNAMNKKDLQQAQQLFQDAVLLAPEESAKDRATKMLLLYQYGVFLLRKWGHQFLSDVSVNPNENQDLRRRIRDYWREALSLFLSLSPQDIRSDPQPLRDMAEKIQEDFISAGLFTPTLEVKRS